MAIFCYSNMITIMSYDIYFLKHEPDQSWEDAMEALEEQSAAPAVLTRPPGWDQVVAGVRYILGDVSVVENPPGWEIDHERTGIQVSCYSREWSITVPYWSDGAAAAVTGHLRAIAGIVQTATGLEAYDPQVDMAVTTDDWTAQQAASVFDQVAEVFETRGIRRG
jgi:hypothetical protein